MNMNRRINTALELVNREALSLLGGGVSISLDGETFYIDGNIGKVSKKKLDVSCEISLSYENFLSVIKGRNSLAGLMIKGKMDVAGSLGTLLRLNEILG